MNKNSLIHNSILIHENILIHECILNHQIQTFAQRFGFSSYHLCLNFYLIK